MLKSFKDEIYQIAPSWVLHPFLVRLAPASSPFLPQFLEKRLIFIHVPKAAGSSLKTSFYGKRGGGHRRIAEFMAYDPQKTQAFFKCAFVRNPWDRLLSAYSYLRQGNGTNRRDKTFTETYLDPHPSFEDFVLSLQVRSYRKAVMAYDHFRPQTYWLCLPGQKDHAMDFIGRFERMQTDLETLTERLNLPGGALEVGRTSQHRPYRQEYTEKTRRIVAEHYADDIALFGYEF